MPAQDYPHQTPCLCDRRLCACHAHTSIAAEAEDAELALRKERRALEDEKHRLELEIERRLEDERLTIREATQKEGKIAPFRSS
jgi:hypothetical protein